MRRHEESLFNPRQSTWREDLDHGIPFCLLCPTGPLETGGLSAHLTTRLDREELSRLERIKLPRKKMTFLLSRVMLKALASRLCPEDTFCPSITHMPGGRPVLRGNSGLHISISHTRTAVAVALNKNSPVAIDLEKIRNAPLKVAGRFFSVEEQTYMRSFIDTDEGFFRLWTLKEAWGKFTGRGILKVLEDHDILFEEKEGVLIPATTSVYGAVYFHTWKTGDGLLISLASLYPEKPLLYSCTLSTLEVMLP